MTVTQARGAANKAKKHSPILHVSPTFTLATQANVPRFGGRLVCLKVGPQRRKFSAHEDMLCMRSKFFKDWFQTARKDVEGECVICHEDLDAVVKTITYCKSCGNNLHQACMEQWFDTSSTCPTCRAEWVMSDFLGAFNLDDTDADGFDAYVQWLYGRKIPTYVADKGDVQVRCRRLVKAHIVGDSLGDEDFVKVVRHEIVKDSLEGAYTISVDVLNTVYKTTAGPCTLRSFMVCLYVLHGNRGNWIHQVNTLCHAALVDLTTHMLEEAELQSAEDIWTDMRDLGYIEPENVAARISERQEKGT
jgi:hypothetical protein